MEEIVTILSTREWAIAIWGTGFFVWMLTQREIRKSLWNVIKILLGKNLRHFFLIIALYVAGITMIFYQLPFWNNIYLKDIILWLIFSGISYCVNSIIMVYDNGEGTVSTIVCNWFGAGSAKLADADNDSSIQTYENIYDVNWLKKGNKMVVPGVERVDTIKTKDGYEMKSIWCRNDIHDTSMMKLSTATGYIYGYVQDLESGMWQFIMLDFETGETAFTMDVSDKPGYNNMAIGMYAGNSGNTLYCPTGYLELLRLQDRFVYLPEMPYRKVDLDKAKRNVLTQEEFTEAGGKGNVAGWLNTITVENVHPNTTVAIRMKGIAGKADTFTLYAYDKENKLKEVPAELWHIQEEDGTLPDKLTEDTLYEVHVMVEDGGEFDLSDTEKEIKIAVILGNK